MQVGGKHGSHPLQSEPFICLLSKIHSKTHQLLYKLGG